MGFSEFLNGLSSAEVAQMKDWEQEQALMQKHEIEDSYLEVLRPSGEPASQMSEKFRIWKALR
jgi:hypothetical protein